MRLGPSSAGRRIDIARCGGRPRGHVQSYFTPRTVQSLTYDDQDAGAAGVMLVPDSTTPGMRLAIAGEKDGIM